MKLENRLTIHAGINFVLSSLPGLDRNRCRKFEEELEGVSINISSAAYSEREFVVARQTPTPLEIKIIVIGPQIGQLLIIAPQPGRSLEVLQAEADDIAKAFSNVWPAPSRQILACDATIRDLYETNSQHAFKELWENRLRQTSDELKSLGRPVLGGGLRFVMPPQPDLSQPAIEIKIESFLSDVTKLFLETQFAWQQPSLPGIALDPTDRLTTVDNYIQKEVVNFVLENKQP